MLSLSNHITSLSKYCYILLCILHDTTFPPSNVLQIRPCVIHWRHRWDVPNNERLSYVSGLYTYVNCSCTYFNNAVILCVHIFNMSKRPTLIFLVLITCFLIVYFLCTRCHCCIFLLIILCKWKFDK